MSDVDTALSAADGTVVLQRGVRHALYCRVSGTQRSSRLRIVCRAEISRTETSCLVAECNLQQLPRFSSAVKVICPICLKPRPWFCSPQSGDECLSTCRRRGTCCWPILAYSEKCVTGQPPWLPPFSDLACRRRPLTREGLVFRLWQSHRGVQVPQRISFTIFGPAYTFHHPAIESLVASTSVWNASFGACSQVMGLQVRTPNGRYMLKY